MAHGMVCPRCETEFPTETAMCPACDVPLVDRLPEASELVEVALFANRFEADVARSALASAGIPVFIGGEQLGSYGPVTAFSQGVRILVRSEDAEDAHAILNETADEISREPDEA